MNAPVFGLNVELEACPPGGEPATAEPAADVRVILGWLGPRQPPGEERQCLTYRSPATARSGSPVLLVYRWDTGEHLFQYHDGTRFVVSADLRQVFATWSAPSVMEDTLVYLFGPVLAFILRRRGTVCLHASGVEIDGKAVLLLGPHGAGKSTLAAAFARRGRPILPDDLAPLHERAGSFHVPPGRPRVLLWASAVESLWGDAGALPQVSPAWSKRFLDLCGPGLQFCPAPLPLGAVYILERRDDQASQPRFKPVRGNAALVHFVANTYGNYLLTPELRAAELHVLCRLLTQVPVRRLQSATDASRLPALCEALEADYRGLGSTRMPSRARSAAE